MLHEKECHNYWGLVFLQFQQLVTLQKKDIPFEILEKKSNCQEVGLVN